MTTKQNMKKTAQRELKNKYGFAPALKEIILLEGDGDKFYCDYVMFRVGHVEYQWSIRHGLTVYED